MEELRKALKSCYDESCVSMTTKDVKGITKYYVDDCWLLWPNFKMDRGIPVLTEMVETLMGFPTPKNFKFTTDELVMMSDDRAYETGHFVVKYDDGRIFNEGKLLVVWKKVKGKWLVEVDSFNNNSKTMADNPLQATAS